MTAKRLLCALLGASLFISSANAIPPPDNSSPNDVNIQDNIRVKVSNVDDIGLVMVWNGHGAETVAYGEWESGGSHGYDSQNVSKYLTKGRNYIIFALYNKYYAGSGFFSGGKWSGDFSIAKNGYSFWSVSKYTRNNTIGIKYWKVIQADVSASGKVTLSEEIPRAELSKLRDAMGDLESKLNRNAGVSTPF